MRFYVLAHVGSDPALQPFYQAHWFLMPDMGLDIVSTPLLHLMPPAIAGHVIAAIILAVLFSGVLYFNRALTGRTSSLVAVLLLPLLYSYILNWGFANFLLSLGFAFWGAGVWLETRARPLIAVPISCVFSVLIYLSHGVAFALYGILVALLEVGFFINTPARKFRDLARALVLVAIQAAIPIVMFLAWQRSLSFDGTIVQHAGITRQALLENLTPRPGHTGYRRLSTILRVEEGPAYWFDIATFAIQFVGIGFLLWCRRISVARPAWLLLGVATLLIAITPSQMFGVHYIADRLPLFVALIGVSAISTRSGSWTLASNLVCAVLGLTAILRIGAIATQWHGYAPTYREFQAIAAQLPRGAVTKGVSVGAGYHETDVPRCEMYEPLLISERGAIVPLFDYTGEHPLVMAGRLKDASSTLRHHPTEFKERIQDYSIYMTAAASAGFDYLLVCNAHLLSDPVPSDWNPIARTPHFVLLRAKRI
ncbi:MAG: hypothetical protein V4527_10715 [Pseudomonadota bacterium]